jgi:VWFA-related protein
MLIMSGNRSRALPRRVPAAILAAWVGAAAAAAAQAPPPAPPGDVEPAPGASFEEEVAVSWILVPVIVKSRKGYVEGLKRQDFQLRVDGKPATFQDFEQRGEAPWSLVFLQDLSGSMGVGGRLEASREAVLWFLEKAKAGDEFALATFSSGSTQVDVPFTEDLDPLVESVLSWEGYGKTALHDAVSWLPDISAPSRNVKRAAVLITDGADNASHLSAAEARELVERAELPVYVLGLESGDPYEVDKKKGEVYEYADVLNLLAYQTGGRYFPIEGPEDLKEACATIAEEMRFQYVLGLETRPEGKPDWHSVQVLVRREGVQVVSRKGYRGTPPAH